jgi:cytidine deaminase
MHKLTEKDHALIKQAKDLMLKRCKTRSHQLTSVVRMKSGNVYSGVHVGLYVRRLSTCAEAVALGTALTEGEEGIDTIVTVRMKSPEIPYEDIRIVSPCGICREMISDYDRDATVIMEKDGELVKFPIMELIPEKYEKRVGDHS